MTDLLARLFDHMAWADDEVVTRALTGHDADDRLARIAAHIIAAEHVWLRRIQGREPELPVWPDPDTPHLAAFAEESARGLRALADLPAGQLERSVRYANSRGEAFETRLVDILLHVALHGSYHRGQLALLARGAGAEPVNTDYITYVRASASPS